jgi:hypothetical protein
MVRFARFAVYGNLVPIIVLIVTERMVYGISVRHALTNVMAIKERNIM